MTKSHNAIPEPCTTMEIVVVPQVLQKIENNKTLGLEIYFQAKYTEINQEKVRQNTSNIHQYCFFYIKEFTLESPWGNAGFFLGISLMQLPQIIIDLKFQF